jgi:hypothetical protein
LSGVDFYHPLQQFPLPWVIAGVESETADDLAGAVCELPVDPTTRASESDIHQVLLTINRHSNNQKTLYELLS